MNGVKINLRKGAENLDSDDKLVLDKLINEYYEKINRHLGSKPEVFEIHLKCHKKEGNTKRYNIEVRFSTGKFRFGTGADEYKLADAIHRAMEKLMSEIEHKIVRKKDERATWKKKARSRVLFR